jgi:hypothetical protein
MTHSRTSAAGVRRGAGSRRESRVNGRAKTGLRPQDRQPAGHGERPRPLRRSPRGRRSCARTPRRPSRIPARRRRRSPREGSVLPPFGTPSAACAMDEHQAPASPRSAPTSLLHHWKSSGDAITAPFHAFERRRFAVKLTPVRWRFRVCNLERTPAWSVGSASSRPSGRGRRLLEHNYLPSIRHTKA